MVHSRTLHAMLRNREIFLCVCLWDAQMSLNKKTDTHVELEVIKNWLFDAMCTQLKKSGWTICDHSLFLYSTMVQQDDGRPTGSMRIVSLRIVHIVVSAFILTHGHCCRSYTLIHQVE